jgi:hypothetical protein
MPMPRDIGIIDLMLGIPSPDPKGSYDFMKPLFRDEESRRSFEFPVEYMFKDVPKTGRHEDYIQYTLDKMASFPPAAPTRTAAWRTSATSCGCTRSSG